VPVACHKITGKITAVTRLHIGSGRRTGVIRHSLPYIPGSFLRGAIGTSIIKSVCRLDKPLKEHAKCEFFEECEYSKLYGEEFGKSSSIFFRYAYPIHLPCNGGIYLPVPKTMFVCESPQCEQGYDRIVPPVKCEVVRDGVRCGGSPKPAEGFICTICKKRTEIPVSTSRITLTAIDRKYQSGAEIPIPGGKAGTLHALDVVEAGTYFSLETIVDIEAKQYLSLVENILSKSLPDEGIGGGKSRGLGKVTVENIAVNGVTTEMLERRAKEIDTFCFGVRLVSPMILDENEILEASALLEAARRAYSWCFHEGKPKLPEVKLTSRRFSYETYSGWSLKDQKRRPIRTAISSGSVFQYECGEKSPELALALAALEYYSIGAYKPHGCGQVIVEKCRS
jgi:CRISPR/Cas system CSM-associated protein Csm3 (group 7 of RAMP superfamily)